MFTPKSSFIDDCPESDENEMYSSFSLGPYRECIFVLSSNAQNKQLGLNMPNSMDQHSRLQNENRTLGKG
jgi:hypothetical protein